MRLPIIVLFLMLSGFTSAFAQGNAIPENEKAAYIKMITERADRIVAPLSINDPSKSEQVRNIIRDQYNNLNHIYTVRDAKIKTIKEKFKADKAESESALKKEVAKTDKKLTKLHKKYLSKLSTQLNAEQIDQVKNGMTYGVLPLTYRAYQEQILTLSDEQKRQILAWLTEARERAMNAESAEKKHAWFGKYKGRINNYLSAAGYDLKKEEAGWANRRKAKTQAN